MEKMVFLFPGQGSHYVGMSKSLYDQYTIAKQTFDEANEVLGVDLAKLCFEGSLAELTKAENSQPAILASSVATFRVYMQELGIIPQFYAGHSLGEYSALTCAGAIKFDDALKIIRYRGILTDEVANSGIGAMTIIDGVDKNIVEKECKKIVDQGRYVAVSCYNSPEQTAISGEQKAVIEVEERLLSMGCQVTPLIASAPFHCPLMKPFSKKLNEELMKYSYGYFKFPVIVNATAQPLTEPDKIIENLTSHMENPVRWDDTMNYLKKKGVTLAIEMGAKNVLTNLVKANTEGIEAICYGLKEDRKTIEDILSAYPNLKKHIPTVVTRCMAVAVSTPNKNWNNDEYNQYVVKTYKRIQEIQDSLEEADIQPTKENMMEALELLKVILAAKKVDIDEQIRWFNQIIDETGTYYVLRDFQFPQR